MQLLHFDYDLIVINNQLIVKKYQAVKKKIRKVFDFSIILFFILMKYLEFFITFFTFVVIS